MSNNSCQSDELEVTSGITEVNSPIISSESASPILASEAHPGEPSLIVGERSAVALPLAVDSVPNLAVSSAVTGAIA